MSRSNVATPPVTDFGTKKGRIFKLSERGPPVIRSTLLSKGWTEWTENDASDGWNLHWKSGFFKVGEYRKLEPYQKINHFPKTSGICKKDSLLRNLRKQSVIHGNIYKFFPKCFILPHEYTKFVKTYSEQETKDIWICKPSDLSRGRKIFLLRDLHDLHYDSQYVLQKYIMNPLLIHQYKWDLRLYCLVTSFHPLRVYLYDEGLVRFGTEVYDDENLDNLYSHLTNASINKFSATYSTDKGGIGEGSKWTFSRLKQHFKRSGVDDSKLWDRVRHIILLTILSIASNVPSDTDTCFELLGFDVIVDSNMKPWLLEVNASPALGTDCPTDEAVKRPLVADTVDTLIADRHLLAKGRERRSRRGRMSASASQRKHLLNLRPDKGKTASGKGKGKTTVTGKGKGKGSGGDIAVGRTSSSTSTASNKNTRGNSTPAAANSTTTSASTSDKDSDNDDDTPEEPDYHELPSYGGSVGGMRCIFPFSPTSCELGWKTDRGHGTLDVKSVVGEIRAEAIRLGIIRKKTTK